MTKGNEQSRSNFIYVNPLDSSSFLMWKANNEMQAILKTKLSCFGLTYVQYIVLATLVFKMNKRAMNQKQISRIVGIDIMMTSQIVRKLEAKKLVSKQRSLIDSRAWSIGTRSKGLKLINDAQRAVEAIS